MHEILDIGGGPGGSLQRARRVGEGAVGSLGDRHPGVIGLFHESDQRGGIVGFQQTVRIECDDIGCVRDETAAGP